MFELSEAIIADIIFAMEDQKGLWMVDLEKGSTLRREEAEAACAADPRRDFADLPRWSSAEGYAALERFTANLRNPNLRRELQTALGRGRGVFKAFKEVLAAYPEAERAFRDFKLGLMGQVIRTWYDELREAHGLERLGPEPEETEDLAASDFAITLEREAASPARILPLVEALEAEAGSRMPAALLAWAFHGLQRELDEPGWIAAWIDDGEGGAIAAAAARDEAWDGQGLRRAFFLFVLPEFRRMGLGRALLERLFDDPGAPQYFLLDFPLLPDEVGLRLTVSGYERLGIRAYRRSE